MGFASRSQKRVGNRGFPIMTHFVGNISRGEPHLVHWVIVHQGWCKEIGHVNFACLPAKGPIV